MLQGLLRLFRIGSHREALVQKLDFMIQESTELVSLAGDIYFQRVPKEPAYEDLMSRERQVNKLQREIRKGALLEAFDKSNNLNLHYCLSLINIVKDLERLGDYAKDLTRLSKRSGPTTEQSYLGVVTQVEEFVEALPSIMKEPNQVEAVRLIEQGKSIRSRLFDLQNDGLGEKANPAMTPADTLVTHYYIRIMSHTLNVLSTLVTPFHRMDSLSKKHFLPEVTEKLQQGCMTSTA